MNARSYAKAGVVIVLIGIGGLVLGEKSLFGVLNIDSPRMSSTWSLAE